MAGGVAGWIGTGSLRAYVICRTFSIAESFFFFWRRHLARGHALRAALHCMLCSLLHVALDQHRLPSALNFNLDLGVRVNVTPSHPVRKCDPIECYHPAPW